MTDLAERFDELRPWFTRFEVDGVRLGGANSYQGDNRIKLFFEWVGQPESILELGSLEGGHSVQLASPDFVKRLLGLEARAKNIERARLAAEVVGRGNIEFGQADLDQASLERYGRFDAVFCAGLLYHLMQPWRLLKEIAKVTDCVFLDTHYSETEDVTIDGYVGSLYAEGQPADHEYRYADTDVLSGLSDSSFWMTLPCITETLSRSGLVVRHELTVPDWDGYGPRVHLAATRE
jgi:SAM-dependent methyltransferase